MTRMGLWSFTCVLPSAEASDPEWTEEEMEQPGTSYDDDNGRACSVDAHNSSIRSRIKTAKACSTSGAEECELGARSGGRREPRVHGLTSCGGAHHMLACFRASAINLIVHPALQVTVAGSQRQGAVQPVNSLPRAATFLDGAGDQESGDEPTSPVVTCIGQVRKEKMLRTPPKTPPPKVTVAGQLRRSLKSKTVASSASSGAPRPSKWRQVLGGRGTSVQPRNDASCEFHVDLNRFSSSACSSFAKADMMKGGRAQSGTFLAKSLMMLQLECAARDDQASDDVEPCETKTREQQTLRPVLATSRASASEVLLWKRRSGAKPLTLDLKRR